MLCPQVLRLLQADPATSSVVSVQGTAIEPGSLIVSMVVEFPVNVVPPRADVLRVLSVDELIDGSVTTAISSVTVAGM